MTTIRIFCINITVVSLFIFLGCEDSTEPKNEPPIITSLTASPDGVEAGGSSTLTCVANDPDGDNLSFNWESAYGSINGNGSIVTWTAPSSEGSYSVSCQVDDGNGGQDIDSINIIVETQINIIAHWNFDEMTGNVLTDVSGNNHHGVITNPNWVNGYNGGALQFGDSTYVTVSYSEELQPSESITIEAIVRVDTFATDEAIISTNENGGYGLWIVESKPDVFIQVDSAYYGAVDTTDLEVGKWYHFAGIFDGSSVSFYVNGILKESVIAQGTITYRYENALQIGADADVANEPEDRYFSGAIDEIRISKEALTTDRFLLIPE